jgi:hypothetical protein
MTDNLFNDYITLIYRNCQVRVLLKVSFYCKATYIVTLSSLFAANSYSGKQNGAY